MLSPKGSACCCITNGALWLLLSKIREKGKGWISPAFGGHLTFLKISRMRGTQIAKPKRATVKTPSVACMIESIEAWYSFNGIGPENRILSLSLNAEKEKVDSTSAIK